MHRYVKSFVRVKIRALKLWRVHALASASICVLPCLHAQHTRQKHIHTRVLILRASTRNNMCKCPQIDEKYFRVLYALTPKRDFAHAFVFKLKFVDDYNFLFLFGCSLLNYTWDGWYVDIYANKSFSIVLRKQIKAQKRKNSWTNFFLLAKQFLMVFNVAYKSYPKNFFFILNSKLNSCFVPFS